MQIQIIAVGERMPAWVQQGYQEYIKRIGAGINVNLVEISAEKRAKNANIEKILAKEAEKTLQAVGKGHLIVALDRCGQSWSTQQLAERFSLWQQDGSNISILIGGPEGISAELLNQAHVRLSISAMTFPHPIVRVVLAEQLYRVWAILNNHPYHK